MSGIFDSIKNLITPELISSAAKYLGEDESNISKAATSLVPGLLGAIMAKGNNPGVESALMSAGRESNNILGSIADIFSGNAGEKTSSVGTQFLNSLLGDKLSGFTSLISSVSGLSSGSSNKFISMIAPIVAGVLGNKISAGGLNLSSLLGLLNKEKSSFLNLIPSGLGSLFGISSFANLGESISSGAEKVAHKVEETAESSMGWLKWLAAILILGLLGFFLMKACNKNKEAISETVTSTTSAVIDSTKEAINNVVERVSTQLTLPDGISLTAYKDGIEDKMITFLNSDQYKNANPDELKDKWFDFDNIEFKHGSATELTDVSHTQIQNIVSILKYFKDAKIKIGGYTDKTGSPEANMKLSQERANTVKSMLEKAGIESARISAEGYGDKFAKFDASAPDSDRSHDRRIALRFEK